MDPNPFAGKSFDEMVVEAEQLLWASLHAKEKRVELGLSAIAYLLLLGVKFPPGTDPDGGDPDPDDDEEEDDDDDGGLLGLGLGLSLFRET